MSVDKKPFIVASDGTEAAKNAVKYVKPLLSPDRHSIIALRVTSHRPLESWQSEYVELEEDKEEFVDEIEKEAYDQLQKDFEHLESLNYDVDYKIVRGTPGAKICDLAEEENAWGIIMGRRERDSQQNVLLGSVSHHVVHHAPCPVTVVPKLNFG